MLVGLVVYGERQEDERDERIAAVSLYIRQVNGVTSRLAIELRDLNRTYARFAGGTADLAGAGEDLRETVGAMEALEGRLQGLDPPEEAGALHREILELVELESELAIEVRDLGLTLPKMSREAAKLAAAGRRLLRDLRVADSLPLQAAAFDRYAKSLDAVARRLSRLNAPAVLEATLSSEVKRLGKLATLADETGEALAAERPADAQRLSNRLARAASTSAAVTRAQREGIEAYGRRIEQVQEQQREVERERERLAASL